MHTLIFSKLDHLLDGRRQTPIWCMASLWTTSAIQDIRIPNRVTSGHIDNLNQYQFWAQVIYKNPGAGRVIIIPRGLDNQDAERIEIRSDEDWVLAVLTYE